MADEVVGTVRLDVEGNTDPLKRDIQRAALEAGKAIDAGVGKGAGGSSITDNIVSQVSDSEQPAGKEAEKVGRAIAKGVDVGSGDVDVTRRINENLRQAEAPLRQQAERLGESLRVTLGRNIAEANRDAVSGLRTDIKMKIDIDREKFRADLTDSQRDWFDFGNALGSSIDRALAPWWRRLPLRMRREFDNRSTAQFGGRTGEQVGVNFIAGIGRGIIGGADWVGGRILGGLTKGLLAVGPQALLYGAGARLAALLGGGLLSGLTVVSQGIAGWAAGIVGQVGQGLIGVSAVVAGTIGTAFAGLGATAYSSIAAIAPALLGLKLAFAGLEKEEKKALEDRFKEAKKAFSGFGQAVRAELLEPLFDSLKAFEVFVPTLKTFGTALGSTAAGIVKSFTAVLTSGPMIAQVNTFLQSSVGYFKQVGNAAIGLAPAVLGAFNAIAPVTQKFFSGIAKGLEGLTNWIERVSAGGKNSQLTTTLDEWYERGRALFQVFKTVAGAVIRIFDAAVDARGEQFLDSLQKVADNFSDFINRVSADGRLESKLGEWYDMGASLASAFGNLSKIVLLFFDSAGSASGDALTSFEETTNRWLQEFKFFRASGDLSGVLSQWFAQGKTMLDILGNVGRTIGNILGVAAGESDGFLSSFERVTASWERWTTSFTGSTTLKAYFEGANSVLGEAIGLLGDLTGIFGETFTAPADNMRNLFQTIREVWIPAIEGLVDSFRDSGLQEAIFNVVKALGGLDDGGVIGKTFEMLAFALDGIAKALQIMAPFVPAFVTFVAAVRTLALLRLGARALGLVALADGIRAIAAARIAAAAGAAAGVTGAAQAGVGGALAAGAARAAGITAGAGAAGAAATAAGSAGLVAGAVALAPLIAAAAAAAGAFVLVNKAVNGAKENIDRFATASDLTVREQADGYKQSLSTFERWGTAVKNFATDWHNLLPGVGVFNGIQALSDIVNDTASDAETLDFLRGGMERFRTEAERMAASGDFTGAASRIQELKDVLEESGGDPAILGDLQAIQDEVIENSALENAGKQVQALADSGAWEAAATKAGQLIASLSLEGVDTEKLQLFKDWALELLTGVANTDAVIFTGSYDQKFMDQAVEDLKKFKTNWDNGQWTEAGKAAKKRLLEGFQQQGTIGPELQKELDLIPKTLQTFDPSKGAGGKWTKEGLELRAHVFAQADHTSINGVKNAIDTATADDIVDIYADPKNYSATTGELKNDFKEKVVDLQITGMERAKQELADLGIFSGQKRDAEIEHIKAQLGPGADRERAIAAANARFKATMEQGTGITTEMTITAAMDTATYNAVIDTVEDDSVDLKLLPNMKAITTPAIQAYLDDYFKNNPTPTVPVKAVIIPPAVTPGTGSSYPNASSGGNTVRGNAVVTPSMISPGGPSTMGFAEAAGPGLLARSGGSGSGVVGSPNYYGKDKDDKTNKNVTINNYYPKPERTSDTIAMQMRLARYA